MSLDEDYQIIQKYELSDSDTVIYYDEDGVQHVVVVKDGTEYGNVSINRLGAF